MHKKLHLRIFFFFTIIFCSSCTPFRIAMFFNPSVNDYKIFPLDTVYASENSKAAFIQSNNNIPPVYKWVPASFRKESQDINQFLEQSLTTTFLVARNDTILFEYYGNKHKKDEPQVIFSATKAIISMLTAIAIKEKKLTLNQKVSDFIPEFAYDERKNLEIVHLLNMVDGLDFSDRGNLARLAVLYYHPNQDKFIANFDKISHRPGTHFSYKSISTQILVICL